MPGEANEEREERVKLPLHPETAQRALLAVDSDDRRRTERKTLKLSGRTGPMNRRVR